MRQADAGCGTSFRRGNSCASGLLFLRRAGRSRICFLHGVREDGWTLSLRRLMKLLLLSRRLLRRQRKLLYKQPHQILFARRVEPSSSPEPAFVRIVDSQ